MCQGAVSLAARSSVQARQRPATAAMLQPVRPCSSSPCFRRAALALPQRKQRAARQAAAAPRAEGGEVKRGSEFGYSRKDVIIIGVGLIGGGYALYYGLQATGMDAGMAGSWAQLVIFLGLTFGWVGSYVFRVATKQMTYVKQLEEYEDAVMLKRLEEMPDGEIERMLNEVEDDKEARAAARLKRQQQQQDKP